MRRAVIAAAIVLAVVGITDARAGGDANFVLGMRSMDDSFWDDPVVDFDRQTLLGVNVDFGGKGWPVQLMASLHNSWKVDDSPTFDQLVWVVDLGFGFVWVGNQDGGVRPYIGAGISSVGVFVDLDYTDDAADTDDADHSLGFFADGGVFFRLGSKFNIGIDLRVVRGTEVTIFGNETDADYEQIGMIFGFGW